MNRRVILTVAAAAVLCGAPSTVHPALGRVNDEVMVPSWAVVNAAPASQANLLTHQRFFTQAERIRS
jgi:hypothetical protein